MDFQASCVVQVSYENFCLVRQVFVVVVVVFIVEEECMTSQKKDYLIIFVKVAIIT